jgi:ABC-2 type transport system permease protein
MSTQPDTRRRTDQPTLDPIEAAIASARRPDPPGAASATLTFGWRGMLKIKHIPEQLMDATIMPVMFVLMFTYLFGGAIAGSTDEYLQFLLPGIFAIQVFTMVYAGVALSTDVAQGVVDRFRTLPIARVAPLLGAVIGDVARFLLGGAVIVGLGLILGFRPGAGAGGILAAMALAAVFAFGLAWVFYAIGLVMRSPQAVNSAGFIAIFPLMFLSNVFVEPETMPAGVRAIAEANPMTHLVTAIRGLMEGTATAGEIGLVLAGTAVLTAIFAPLTVRLYYRSAG